MTKLRLEGREELARWGNSEEGLYLAKGSGRAKAWRPGRKWCDFKLKEIQPGWSLLSERESQQGAGLSRKWPVRQACLGFGFDPLKVLREAAGCFQQETTVDWSATPRFWDCVLGD